MNIKEDLKKLIDEEYKKFHSTLCPGINNILGVRIPILREYAKQLGKNNNTDYLLKLLGNDYYEEIMLQGMLIGLDKKLEFKNLQKYIDGFVPKIDNWAVCDVFCAGLKITKKYKMEMFELIKRYLKSDKEFEVRFAIVMILDYYIEEEYILEDFKIFENVKLDKYYVKMAIAWAISVCLIKYYDQTILYLKNNFSLDDWTYNKSIQKAIESYRITNVQKEKLRKIKR